MLHHCTNISLSTTPVLLSFFDILPSQLPDTVISYPRVRLLSTSLTLTLRKSLVLRQVRVFGEVRLLELTDPLNTAFPQTPFPSLRRPSLLRRSLPSLPLRDDTTAPFRNSSFRITETPSLLQHKRYRSVKVTTVTLRYPSSLLPSRHRIFRR